MAFMDAVAQDSRVKVSVAHEMANPRWVNTSERKYELSAVTLHDVSNDAARNFLNILMRDREKKK